MSKDFSTISFKELLRLTLSSVKDRKVFGLYFDQFYREKNEKLAANIFSHKLGTPLGVAAGPQTQMAQNIISAWLCGARYIELKTIQTLDEIEVSKPCIDMQDEGYNCEWSQELKIEESFREYLKAWIIIHILNHKFNHGRPLNTVFNMSVGYDMRGILKDNVQWFLRKMKNCENEKRKMLETARSSYPQIDEVEIPNMISDNVTLSTMHGCPPEEIESIGKYLLEKKKLHTYIKFNPTLLGKEKIGQILDDLNFKTVVPDQAFEHDIGFNEALKVIDSLNKTAEKQQLHFGIKLTNTLESGNHKNKFDSQQMYMSGKALHPIAINTANKIRSISQFKNISISFCGGVNALNIKKIISCGLYPVTVSSDLLKPGGYGRLKQYLINLKEAMEAKEAENLDDFIKKHAQSNDLIKAQNENLKEYSKNVLKDTIYEHQQTDIKTERKLGSFDCIAAPCVNTCPSNQRIPEYLYQVASGDLNSAYRVILANNPFPHSTGLVCDHKCQTKCTRINYDSSILIRAIKRFVAENAAPHEIRTISPSQRKSIAVIGGGPSGLAAAYYLALAGFEVKVYETKELPGGMLSYAIPKFRLNQAAVNKDIDFIKQLGVQIITSQKIDREKFRSIREQNDYIYVAVGAQKARSLPNYDFDNEKGVINPLEFLSKTENGFKLGKEIIVIGGGNTAIDVARTAKFKSGKNASVKIVYRRTEAQMPADMDEIKAAKDEGIEIIELASPKEVVFTENRAKQVTFSKMKLGKPDKSGRPKPVPLSNQSFNLKADTIIPALGQLPALSFLSKDELAAIKANEKTISERIYIGGDAERGASTVIEAIADGRETALKIMRKSDIDPENIGIVPTDKHQTQEKLYLRRSKIIPGQKIKEIPVNERRYSNLIEMPLTKEEAELEAERCLYCDELCDVCVTVCPNRANFSYEVTPFSVRTFSVSKVNNKTRIKENGFFEIKQKYQILNIDDFCNECGNCETFCPTSGKPYKDKPKVFLTKRSFAKKEDGFYADGCTLNFRSGNKLYKLEERKEKVLFSSSEDELTLAKNSFEVLAADIGSDSENVLNTAIALRMYVVLQGLKKMYKLNKNVFKRKDV